MKKCLSFFFLFFVTLAPLFAEDLYDDRKVAKIQIVIENQDEESPDPKPILSRMRTKEGDPFSQVVFDSDLKSLSDEYDRVDPSLTLENGQIVITLHITPKPLIHLIEWNGNEKFRTSTLRKELGIKPNTVFNRQEFNKAFNKLKELYFKNGYFESQISYTLHPIPNTNQVDISIEIEEGRPGYIQKIELTGFTPEEKSALEEQMYLKKYNFLTHWMTGAGTFRDELLEQDRMTILTLLHNRGYADARVDIELTEDPETERLIVEITAHRGQLFHFGTIEYEGNTLFPTDEIQAKATALPGEVFSPEKVRETAQAIKDFYGKKGYIDTSVQYETLLEEEAPTFNIVFTIDEGKQYRIGLVHIFGNSSTQSNVILRESLLVPGETFDSRKLKATQQKLEAIGFFKSVNVYAVRTQDDEALGENYRDVYIEVEEMSTGNISLFLGFSSIDNVYGGLDLMERNFNIAGIGKALGGKLSALRGNGEFFRVRGMLGKKENNILISWMNPYLNDTLWRLGVDLSRTYSKLQNNVKVVTYGGTVNVSYPLSNFWTAGMRQRVRHAKDVISLDPIGTSTAAQNYFNATKNELDQEGLISAFSFNINYNSVDSPIKPHRGWNSTFEAESSGVGGNYYFAKISYLNALYFPLWSKGTLKLRGEFKYIFPFGKTTSVGIPYSERFFLGGETTIRGYKPFILGPLVRLLNDNGQLQETDTPLGGLSSSLLSLEYNQEIFRMLDAFAFFDVGSLDFSVFTINKVRPTTGVGLRLDLGNRAPIMVGWGIPLVKEDRTHTKWQKWFFAMGGQF